MSPTPFHPRFPIGMQFGLMSSARPAMAVVTAAPLKSVTADVVQEPMSALIGRLQAVDAASGSTEASADVGGRGELSTADASAILALPIGGGFGVYAVVVTMSDPVTAAIWALAAFIATVALMRYGDTNQALKAVAAWIANVSENDKDE
jgi:hypothetical protein